MILLLAHERSDGDIDTYHLKPGRRYHIGRGSGCEVRILDLKLSRKHAAVEHLEGSWRFVDLGSTNGCTVDDILADDPMPLRIGSRINLGQTTLTVADLLDPHQAPPQPVASAPAPVPPPVPPTPLAAAVREAAATAPVAPKRKEPSNEFPPVDIRDPADDETRREPLTAIKTAQRVDADAKAPLAHEREVGSSGRRAAVPAPLPPLAVASLPPVPPPVAAETGERPFFITVLGQRIGPLSKAEARDLKARELKGQLKAGDLDLYPKA